MIRERVPRFACLIAFILVLNAAVASNGQTTRELRLAAIRTPAAPASPLINGPRIFGARPGHPFLYHIPATGERPIAYAAAGLPDGLTLDPSTGNITGTVRTPGSFAVTFIATNSKGTDSIPFTIVISRTISLTPPLGWNSWNYFAGRVKDADIRGAADQFVSTGLINHGWTYINIDDTWEGQRDADGKILTNQKFPDMKALSDYIHTRGLKFGIYSSPGPQTCARFTATYQHEDQDAQTYADWGVDYVKYDWCSYQTVADSLAIDRYAALLSADDAAKLQSLSAERAKIPGRGRGTTQRSQIQTLTSQIADIEKKIDADKKKQIDLDILQEPYDHFRASLDRVNRDIVYSLCQYGRGDVWTWGDSVGGNLWRTTGDISANWRSMTNIGFAQNEHAPFAGPGHWNDPDMLEVGNGSLTPDENYTHMTLWCMLAAPLLIGCDMPHMDELTTSMFSNDEVLAGDQDSLGKQGYRLKADGTSEVWIKPLAGGATAVAFFNRGTEPAKISVAWSDLKISGAATARDLWRQKDLSTDGSGLSATVNGHSAELFRVSPRN